MSFSWGTVIAGAVSAVVVWFVTNGVLAPWVEKRRRRANRKVKQALEPVLCGNCNRSLPAWFMGFGPGHDAQGRATTINICRVCSKHETFRRPEPDEEEDEYESRRRKADRSLLKSIRKNGPLA